MGVSTDAILAFGLDLGAEEDLPEELQEVEDGLDDWVYQQGDLPYEVVRHCSNEYPMYFLAAKGTVSMARRGFSVTVDMPEPSAAALDAMRAFCERHGLEWSPPEWRIFSFWG